MSESDIWTVKRLLEWTADFLRKRGSSSPRLEAEVLLAFALGCSRIELYTQFDAVPDEARRGAFRDLVRRRGESEPVAYLTGRKEFYSLDFEVSSDVLIPRPETEQIALEGIEFLRARRSAGAARPRILDLGVGSGALAVVLAKNVPDAEVTAVDISEKALDIARRNAQKHGVVERIAFVESDLFKKLPTGSLFDLLVSNPPYVSQAEYDRLDPMVRDYEPQIALLAGPLGTEIFDRLVQNAPNFLVSCGLMLIEISPMIAQKCVETLEKNGSFEQIDVLKDLSGLDRAVSAKRK